MRQRAPTGVFLPNGATTGACPKWLCMCRGKALWRFPPHVQLLGHPTCMHRGDWCYLNTPTGRLQTARERQAGALHSCTVCAVLTEGEQVQHPATAHPTACVWFGIFRKVCVGSVLCDAGRMPLAAMRWVLELCCVQSCKTSSRDDSRVCICGMCLLTNCYFVAPCPYLSCAFHCRCGCVQLWIVLLCSASVRAPRGD